MKTRYALFLCVCISFFTATAQPQRIVTAGFITDQDFFLDFARLNKDQNYTMGASFFVANNRWAKSAIISPARLMSKAFYNFTEGQENAVIQAGVTGFTPRYLGDNVIDSIYYMKNDRPFSSLLFLSTKHQVMEENRVMTSQLVVGVLGLNIAREVQTHIHANHWFGSEREIPTGWGNQISQDGEFTFLLSNKTDHLFEVFASRLQQSPVIAQVILSREYRLGYYTGANAGAALKFGILDRSRWASYDVYQMGYANMLHANNMITAPPAFQGELYFLTSLRPNFFLHNSLLNGQFKEDNFHTLSFTQTNRVVVEGMLGIGGTIPFCKGRTALNILAYASGRSPEFNLPLKRYHYWGGLQLSFSYL